MRRFTFVIVFAVLSLAANGRSRAVRFSPETLGTSFGAPLSNLTEEQRQRFEAGAVQFIRIRSAADGLGPVFNGPDCRQCHHRGTKIADGIAGGGSDIQVVRIGTLSAGVFDPLTRFGGSVLQGEGLSSTDVPEHPFRGELIPAEARFVSQRVSPSLFGLGLVDATPDETFRALAQKEALADPATAGRVSIVRDIATNTDAVGKFGWKAHNPSLLQFSGEAFLGELGITSPQFPDENCPSGDCRELAFNPVPALNDDGSVVRRVADFMMMLGPPPRGEITPGVLEGEALFSQIGCANCHVAALTSGASEIAALDHKIYHPYSDFLLHDMGSLGDGIEQESAKGNEFRTAPLWGVRGKQALLHDGRAANVEEATLAHDGQAKGARDRFKSLTASERAKVVEFLKSL